MIRRLAYLAFFILLAYSSGRFFLSAYVDRPQAGAAVAVVIPEGADVARVATLLREQRLASEAWYRWFSRIDASARRPKSGTYQIQPGSSMRTIARVISVGPSRKESEARLIEGWTVEDESLYLQSEFFLKPDPIMKLIGRSADRAPFDVSLREDFAFLKNLPKTRSLEGYLFPETYRIWEDQLPDGLVRKQLAEFGTRYGSVSLTSKIAPLKTLDDVVILASIIEKEVRDPADRKIVAGIFLRRMKDGMALQSDATLTYLTGSTRARSTTAELALDTPYNSYKYRGLPPSPICNPAASAIEAVLEPTPSNYHYFLTDAKGKVYYAATLEEHGANRIKAGY